MVQIDTSDLPPAIGERFELEPQTELRFEVPHLASSVESCRFILQKGSCELWGCELAEKKEYTISDGAVKLALFTWHGCVIDVDSPGIDVYDSTETDPNVSYVNTHAQLESMRDEAAAAASSAATGAPVEASALQGPRVMVVGPSESGKTSLAKTLVAYACKVGRSPLWVDLDPMDNSISVPGTLAVAPMTAGAVTVETYATTGVPPSTPMTPLVLWHGSSSKLHADLFKAQVAALAGKIDKRLEADDLARSSGIVVNTNGWIERDGYDPMLSAIESLKINIVLIMGQEKLYSKMTRHFKKNKPTFVEELKVLNIQPSGGVVKRSDDFIRYCRSRAIKRYFYGDLVDPSKKGVSSLASSALQPGRSSEAPGSASANRTNLVPQLTPFRLQIQFSKIKIFRLSSMSLAKSLLPVAQQQTTDAIQVEYVECNESLKHALLAVCHPASVHAYSQSNRARDLLTAGVAGFCSVEQVNMDTDMLEVLSPCTGSLPSDTLLIGDVSWTE